MHGRNTLSAPIIILADCQGDNIVECGDGISSNFRAFDLLTSKSSEPAPEHSMSYLKLKALGKKYETIIILTSQDSNNFSYRSTVEKLNQEQPNKYKTLLVTTPISKHENLGDKYISQDECMERLDKELVRVQGNCCIIVDGLESPENMIYAHGLQQKILNFYPNKSIVIANSPSGIAGLTENKFMFIYFDPEQDIANQSINCTQINDTKVKAWKNKNNPVVIKPSNNHGGYGVIVCKPEKLSDQLLVIQRLVNGYDKNDPRKIGFSLPSGQTYYTYYGQYRDKTKKTLDDIEQFADERGIPFKDFRDDRQYEGWKYVPSNQGFAVIQRCYKSHEVDDHNATLRMLFLVHEDMSIEVIGSFWKLASEPISEDLDTSNVVSSSGEEGASNYRLLTPEEQAHYFEIFKPKILTIIGNACEMPLQEHIEKLQQHSDVDVKALTQEILIPQFTDFLPNIDPKATQIMEEDNLQSYLQKHGSQITLTSSPSFFKPGMKLNEYILNLKDQDYESYAEIKKVIQENDIGKFNDFLAKLGVPIIENKSSKIKLKQSK